MSRLKANKINRDITYPCPCRKQGELHPIALTEALGCSRCNHIFVVRSDGYVLEQLSGAHPYKQLWYWTGREWSPVRPSLQSRGCAWAVGLLSIVFLALLCLVIASGVTFNRHVVVWIVLMICIAVILSFTIWLAMQQRF